MITSSVKTANKSFRIWRPDETLDDICKTNGPSIVRKMIPCFPELPDDFEDGDPNSFPGPKYPEFSFVYGVNVRTPRVNSILPFSTSYTARFTSSLIFSALRGLN